MGKIVKYCNACEESFAEKFGFCPICGETLKAFEMNPVGDAVKDEKPSAAAMIDSKNADNENSENFSTETLLANDQTEISETNAFLADESETVDDKSEFELDLADEEENSDEVEPIAKPKFAVAGAGSGLSGDVSDEAYQTKIDYTQRQPIDSKEFSANANDDDKDVFSVTVLTEKNVKERNFLFLGVMVLMVSLCFGGLIYSIFNHPLLVSAIGEDNLVSFVPVVDEVPMDVEEEVQQKKDDEDGGGGGGGGREEQTPTSKGRLATQTEKPIIAPDTSIVQRKAELQQPVASTQGKNEIPPTEEPYGDPTSKYTALSNGTGSGSGQGSGVGTGQGSGRGTGQGSGIGSGSGSGIGDSNGGGRGSGTGGNPEPREPKPSGATKDVVFLAKPSPKYTDAARQNNIQGNVVLKITFLANGQIGSIAPVTRLPHGLTEQAIAAARQIRFTPALKDGQPVSKIKSVQFSFTIY